MSTGKKEKRPGLFEKPGPWLCNWGGIFDLIQPGGGAEDFLLAVLIKNSHYLPVSVFWLRCDNPAIAEGFASHPVARDEKAVGGPSHLDLSAGTVQFRLPLANFPISPDLQ